MEMYSSVSCSASRPALQHACRRRSEPDLHPLRVDLGLPVQLLVDPVAQLLRDDPQLMQERNTTPSGSVRSA